MLKHLNSISTSLTGLLFLGTILLSIYVPDVATKYIYWISCGYFALVICYIYLEISISWIKHHWEYHPLSPQELPDVYVIIVAYLPNEKEIIMTTLRHYSKLEYPTDKLHLILAYNTPEKMEIMERIQEYADTQPNLQVIRVKRSTSKSQNLNYVLDNIIPENHQGMIALFDTDHHPEPTCLEKASYYIFKKDFDFIQGKCRVRNEKETWLTKIVMFDFELIYSIFHESRYRLWNFGIFGGTNGYWKSHVLRKLKFKQEMLTEDIDLSVRALREGYKSRYVDSIISTELAPKTIVNLIKERLRWAQGWIQVSARHFLGTLVCPKLSIRKKIGLFFMLGIREIYPFFNIIITPLVITNWINRGFDLSPLGLIPIIINILTYPFGLICLYNIVPDAIYQNKKSFFRMTILGILYNFFSTGLCLVAFFRNLLGFNKWEVTSR